jgi:hypothetical protein
LSSVFQVLILDKLFILKCRFNLDLTSLKVLHICLANYFNH